MATKSPIAVVTSASEIPPATAPRPVDFSVEMPLNALMMRTTVPNRATNGAGEHIAAVHARRRAEGMSRDETIIFDFVTKLVDNKGVSHATLNAAEDRFEKP